jgi:hypothetical protein
MPWRADADCWGRRATYETNLNGRRLFTPVRVRRVRGPLEPIYCVPA